MGRVYETIDATLQIGGVPGLRGRLRGHLLGVLESAVEMRKLLCEGFADDQAPLLARVGDYEVSYALDVSTECVTVLSVTSLAPPAGGQTGEQAAPRSLVLPLTRPEAPSPAGQPPGRPEDAPLAG